MKKLLIGALATISITSAYAEIGTVDQYLEEHYKWQSDPASLVYLNTRCAALNASVTYRFDGLNDKSSIELRNQYDNATNYFINASVLFGAMAGVSDEALVDRGEFWAKQYSSQIYDNWIKHNQYTYGSIGDDLVACNKKVYVTVTDIVDYFNKVKDEEVSL